MKIRAKAGCEDLAVVYIMETDDGKVIECVESVQPPLSRHQKWVLIISSLDGCPVGCKFCEAGGDYRGRLSAGSILNQIDYLVQKRFPQNVIPVEKFKIQFARMGEPALNDEVLEVLKILPDRYQAPGLMISLSTIAPKGRESFFKALHEVKERYYNDRFQFQFSIHSTDDAYRRWLIPYPVWSFAEMARYGERFRRAGDKKITLNFALARNTPMDPDILGKYFDPDHFLIKITPVNPTEKAASNHLSNSVDPESPPEIIADLERLGYRVILSIGELEENRIGSNCGQYISRFRREAFGLNGGYTYELQPV